ncbi:Topoisomerase [Candidatus Nitrosocaldus cavascurensis]|uniref:Topoisomerase n=1 Tax=Candidatus Nitrosocaldus cavascurensis TaxID=2058097 RepID=A0A2K5ARM1_9ARCH|nr:MULTISPECIES: toprim domain-containing protein [Candidatus Nitrosocaldus]SPC34288.1 Topoisomerase [Candidatus Nitrosocaldus cavascurensis]
MERVDEQEVKQIKDFIEMLNYESTNGAVVLVEGKRDSNALKALGFSGKITVLNSHRGLSRVVDNLEHASKVILLLDMDSKGRYLTQRLLCMIANRKSVDLFYKRRLMEITRGRIRSIEELMAYRYSIAMSNPLADLSA